MRFFRNFSVVVKASFCDKEGKNLFDVIRFDQPRNVFKDLGHSNSVDSVVSNQAHLHFLIFVHVIFTGLETESLNDLPLAVVELYDIEYELGGAHELEKLDCACRCAHSQVKNAVVRASQVVEHVHVFFLTSNSESFRLQIEAEFVPNLTSKRAEIFIGKKHPECSLEPHRTEEGLVEIIQLHQEGLSWYRLIVKQALKEHCNLKARASLHKPADKDSQVA